MKRVFVIRIFSCFLLFSVCSTGSNVANSQNINKKAIKKNLKKAESAFFDQNFRSAINYYTALDSLVDPIDKGYVNYQLGMCYLYSNIDNQKALEHILKAEEQMGTSEIADIFYYHLGRAHHLNENFEAALNAYKKLDEIEIYEESLSKEVEYQKQITENAMRYAASPSKLNVYNAGLELNSAYPDYKPVISADESRLIFTSRRGLSENAKKDLDGKYFEDIFMVTRDDYGYWTIPKSISSNINTETHEASVGLSPDGSQLLLYRGNPDVGGIYLSRLIGSDWSLPTLIDGGNKTINNKRSWETSASMTADGKTVYFTSNRKGGIGGLDIFYSKLGEDGQWQEPVNLGAVVNTELNEESPFIHPDGKTLYFSSKGHQAIGGYDIFKSTLENGQWSTPENLGFPINSAADDIHFVITADGTKAYYSSSRKGSVGEQDIYTATLKEKVSPLILVKGIVKTEDEGPINVVINVLEKTDGEPQRYIYNPNIETGKYLMILPSGKAYDMVVSAEGYNPYMVDINIPNQTEFHELYQEITLKKVTAFGKTVGQEIVVVNSFDNLRTSDVAQNEIGEKQANPEYLELLIEQIAKKADKEGLKNLNQTADSALLAEINKIDRITDAVVDNFDKLKEKKAYSDAASSKHYYTNEGKAELTPLKVGDETVMVVPSSKMKKVDVAKLPDNTIDNSDLVIVDSEKQENPVYALPSEKVDKELIAELNLQPQVKENGDTTYIVPDNFIALTEKPKSEKELAQNTSSTTKTTVEKPTLKPESSANQNTNELSVIVEKMVNFEFDRTDITDQYRTDLDVLIDMVQKYPKYKIEITGHTDSRGSEAYNMRLSKQRAQVVADYLIEKGVKKEQLIVLGYGEERPIAPNSNPDGSDNPNGRFKNRRTEIKLKG